MFVAEGNDGKLAQTVCDYKEVTFAADNKSFTVKISGCLRGYHSEYQVFLCASFRGNIPVNYASFDANKTRIIAKNLPMYIKQLVVQRMVTHLEL